MPRYVAVSLSSLKGEDPQEEKRSIPRQSKSAKSFFSCLTGVSFLKDFQRIGVFFMPLSVKKLIHRIFLDFGIEAL